MLQIYLRSLFIFVFCFLLMSKSHAQGQKFAFLEGMGSGALVNANFDMRFKSESREGLGFKAGIGYSGLYMDEQYWPFHLVSIICWGRIEADCY